MATHAKAPRHARGAHAKKRNPIGAILSALVMFALVATIAPALMGAGIILGILGGWLTRGFTKL